MYSKICDIENIYDAYIKARRNKRYKEEILRYSYNIENNLENIKHDLEAKTYKHGKYYEFVVNDSKKRVIKAAPFKDRIIHHAVCNIIEPIFDKKFIYDSYACRKDKGLHKAIKRFKKFLRIIKTKNNLENYDNIYCLKCDIVKYFKSVDKVVLIELIERNIFNKEVLNLIKIILDSNKIGLPIGNLTSQLFANIYLHELDFYIKNVLKCKYYIRYMDDFVILGLNKKDLWIKYEKIKFFVLSKLKLKIDDQKTKLIPLKKGVDFLGFTILSNKIKLRKSTIKRFKKKINIQLKYTKNKEKLRFLVIKFFH
ncbi:MAG: reverse transcriptase/maturase family protein [Candidatus Pacebacteria bacterium]|nr:reverse transcriptase/maturase family protein [Candidatus Paceibacterota bacterium]